MRYTVRTDIYNGAGRYLGGGYRSFHADTPEDAATVAIATERESWGHPRLDVRVVSVEAESVSPFVRRAKAGELPAKVVQG